MKIKLTSVTLLTAAFSIFCLFASNPCSAQTPNDTIKVMAYNTLDFGPGACQDNPQTNWTSIRQQDSMLSFYAQLNAIFQFAKPDIIGLDKMQCVDTGPNNNQGISPYTFPDTIIAECFNTNYSFCPFTDISGCSDGDGSILFYNHAKIGYVSTTNLYEGTEDIDLYKLYYKDPLISISHDTTFLYTILCHTISGNSSTGRDGQATTVINALKGMFTHTPNLIYMGDFNTHNSSEPGYELITQTTDTNFILNDPPFHPDAKYSYPIDWTNNPAACAKELTTTTRSTSVPNTCGTTGGAKSWYDHIFLSPWIVNGNDYISYIKNSYTTIGNDGNRVGLSVNTGSNTSAPSNVVNAVFNFSDKYPVMVSLALTNHVLGVTNILEEPGSVKVNNPVVDNSIVLHFAAFMNGENITMNVYDVCGRDLYKSTFVVNGSIIDKEVSLTPGVYMFHFTSGGYSTTLKVVKE